VSTLMRREALEASEIVENQLSENQQLFDEISHKLIQQNPYSLVTVARGSSDHAAAYLNFLATAKLGKLTTSLSMSALTLYNSKLDVSRSLGIAISQSGQSPDVVTPMEYMRANACSSIAMVNNPSSPLANAVEWCVPILAGEEKSVAATKSFIASLTASASLVAAWNNDLSLSRGLHHLSDDLTKAQRLDWSRAVETLASAKRIMTVGRGYGLSLAQEDGFKA